MTIITLVTIAIMFAIVFFAGLMILGGNVKQPVPAVVYNTEYLNEYEHCHACGMRVLKGHRHEY